MSSPASTTLLGPYDNLTTSDKTMVSGALPHAVRDRLFFLYLPRRGAIDKVITRVLYLLDAYITTHPELEEFDEFTREQIVNNFFNSITSHLQTLKPTDIIPQ